MTRVRSSWERMGLWRWEIEAARERLVFVRQMVAAIRKQVREGVRRR